MCRAKVHYCQGDFVSAHLYGERALALDHREYHEAYLAFYNEDGGLSARREHSYCLWALGYPDRAMALSYETVSLAKQTSHPFSLGAAYQMTASNLARCGEWQAGEREARKVLLIAEEYALGDMGRHSTVTHTLMLAFQEPTEEALVRAKQAIDALAAQGTRAFRAGNLTSLGRVCLRAGRGAEGLAVIEEALALVERTGERVAEAELWRVKGELLLQASASDAESEAERCYRTAIDIARRQHAKSWELRAATNLARLWQRQGNHQDARQLLAEIYGWFSEGFDTADLKDARGLLDELSSEERA
jgi:tetratricopeptide (TPR) repeat protein